MLNIEEAWWLLTLNVPPNSGKGARNDKGRWKITIRRAHAQRSKKQFTKFKDNKLIMNLSRKVNNHH